MSRSTATEPKPSKPWGCRSETFPPDLGTSLPHFRQHSLGVIPTPAAKLIYLEEHQPAAAYRFDVALDISLEAVGAHRQPRRCLRLRDRELGSAGYKRDGHASLPISYLRLLVTRA